MTEVILQCWHLMQNLHLPLPLSTRDGTQKDIRANQVSSLNLHQNQLFFILLPTFPLSDFTLADTKSLC